jgi:hypothetical protein
MPYTGQWIRKGFTYLTGPTQTSMIIYVRNNAPGGGGNDWALDDITVASCVPSISLTPNKPDTLCRGADDTVRFKVTAFFDNYTQWKLEKSTDGGATWISPGIDTTGQAPSGSAVPVFNPSSGLYEYLVTRYFRLNNVDTTVIYRLTIASTSGSLSNSGCSYTTSSPKIVRTANCNVVLPTQVTVRGLLKDGSLARILWTSFNETSDIQYVVERSDDGGLHYTQLATIPGKASAGMGESYTYDDPSPVNSQSYYRIEMIDQVYHNYSRIVLLSSTEIALNISGLVNPFVNQVSFNLTVPEDRTVQLIIFDSYGRRLTSSVRPVYKGINRIELYEPGVFQSGMYILQVIYKDQILSRQIIKQMK